MISHSVETPRGTGAFFFNTLRLRRPIKAESGIVLLLVLTPSPCGHSTYICCAKHPAMLRDTAEEEGEMYFPFASLRFYM